MITFNKSGDNLSGVLAGEDHISGLLAYGTAPGGWAVNSVPIRQLGSLKQAEDLGITSTSDNKTIWYHISEYFRINPNSILYVGIYAAPSLPADYTYAQIKDIQDFANGKIRQIAVYVTIDFLPTHLALLQAIYADLFTNDSSPLAILYAANIKTVTDLATLADLRALTNPNISVCIGQDGDAVGAGLFALGGSKTISCIGAMLGTVSKASVHENIGWIANFNVASTELAVPAFGNGQLAKSLTKAQLEALSNKGYIFVKNERGIGGTYFNDSHTCTPLSNDFNRIERNRTIDKAVRGVRAALLPQQNAPVRIDPTSGKLAPEAIAYFTSLANRPIQQMEKDGELSGYKVFIDPDQNFLTAGVLTVNIKNVPLGIVFNFNVNIGFSNQV